MGTLSSLFELHDLSGGWSSLAIIALAVAIVLVGYKVMLGISHESWLSHNIVLVCMITALVHLVLFAVFAFASYRFFGLTWIGVPLGVLAMLALVFIVERMGFLSRSKHGP